LPEFSASSVCGTLTYVSANYKHSDEIILTFQNVSHAKQIISGEEHIESKAKFHYIKMEQLPLEFSE
jgi:hypothetical protein